MGLIAPGIVRSRLVLEVASELVGRPDVFAPGQASVLLRRQGARRHEFELFGSDGPVELERVSRRDVDVAIINPSAMLTLAVRGISPFHGPLPLRAVTVLPSLDQLALVVRADLGIRHAEELAGLAGRLRISVRDQHFHSVHVAIDHVLQAAGTSLGDLRSAGATLHYDAGMPEKAGRLEAVQAGERDAIFEEGAPGWLDAALAAGMRVLTLSEESFARLESWGYRRAVITRERHPGLEEDVLTVDFSGWPVYVHAKADTAFVTLICEALEARRSAIMTEDGIPLPLDEMCSNTPATPLDVPLHPAARAFWTKRGYLEGRPSITD